VYLLDMQTHDLFQITQFADRSRGIDGLFQSTQLADRSGGIVGTVAWSPDNTQIATAFDEHERNDEAQVLIISLADTPFVPVDCTRDLTPPSCQSTPTSTCS
jgi:hypothetical protein